MSYYREHPFNVSGDDQTGWEVDFEGTPVQVANREDALLLAELPVELCKMVSCDQQADQSKLKRLLTLCNEYNIERCFAVRQLSHWLNQNRE